MVWNMHRFAVKKLLTHSLYSKGLLQVTELKKILSSICELELLKTCYFLNFYDNFIPIYSLYVENFGTVTTLWAIFCHIYSAHAQKRLFCHFLSKFWHRRWIQRPRFAIIQRCFCDRWSFAIYINFITSGFSRYSSTRWDTQQIYDKNRPKCCNNAKIFHVVSKQA